MAAPLPLRANAGPPQSGATDETQASGPEAAPPRVQVQDADGNPLPPEIQRELQERFRDGLPPPAEPEPALPAPPTDDARSPTEDAEVVVQGQRPRGSVTADIPPERTFSPLDINAYGANDVGELLQALGPQVSGNGGREGASPVTLLNGRRVSGFAEIAQIPTEAIERMEVFPEELALQYGYGADQKVVNIVTYERFRSSLGRLGSILATEGGYGTGTVQASHFAIRGGTRFDFGLEYSGASSLLESERNLAQLDEAADAGRFRTLVAETERITVNGLVSGQMFGNVSATLSGRFEASGFQSLLGRGANGPLARDTDIRTAQLGTTLHGQIGRWLWTFTGGHNRISTETLTDAGGAARDRARSIDSVTNAVVLLSGALLTLPAGPLSTNIRGSLELRDFSSSSLRGGIGRQAGLSRDVGAVQVNLNAPIARRGRHGATLLGDLALNATFEVERLSDHGALHSYGYGFNWSPARAINIVGSALAEQSAPTMEQLGAPLLATSNVRTLDFARGEVVDITRTSGGNPELRPEGRDVFRLGVNVRPPTGTDFVLSADYLLTRTDHPVAAFPSMIPDVEAAFPERFTRSADGRLLQVDARPLNFERSRQEQLRWGFSFVRPLGPVDPWMRTAPIRTYSSEADARAAAPPSAIVSVVPPGSALARSFENLASRLFINIYHTWRLRDEIVLRAGLPALDLLGGAAIDPRGDGRRHGLEAQAGIFKRGLGARVAVRWRSGAAARGGGGEAGDLSFPDLATVDINLFANLQDRLGGADAPGWLRRMRFTFAITNLFNARPRVQDATGSTPLSYQPAYLDPFGRRIGFSLRKVF